MNREKKQVEEDQPAGAPDWMVTFSDCMTLLLTFFVLLLSFSTFGKKTLPGLGTSFARSLPSIGLTNIFEQDSMWQNDDTKHRQKVTKGTETRNLEDKPSSNFMSEKKALDFRNLKVFTTQSSNVFWANGSAISKSGKEILDALATFLHVVPSRVVISENGPNTNNSKGLQRAWKVVDYLTTQKRLKKQMFSITASTTMRDNDFSQRILEITLLERNIYE